LDDFYGGFTDVASHKKGTNQTKLKVQEVNQSKKGFFFKS